MSLRVQSGETKTPYNVNIATGEIKVIDQPAIHNEYQAFPFSLSIKSLAILMLLIVLGLSSPIPEIIAKILGVDLIELKLALGTVCWLVLVCYNSIAPKMYREIDMEKHHQDGNSGGGNGGTGGGGRRLIDGSIEKLEQTQDPFGLMLAFLALFFNIAVLFREGIIYLAHLQNVSRVEDAAWAIANVAITIWAGVYQLKKGSK